jgi:hypothetical protein
VGRGSADRSPDAAGAVLIATLPYCKEAGPMDAKGWSYEI